MPQIQVKTYNGTLSIERTLVDAGTITEKDVQILIQAQKWWEVRRKHSSPEWVIIATPLPDDIAGRGKVAGLSELNYSEVSLHPVVDENDVPVPFTNRSILRTLFHENAHRYYQDKGRFSPHTVSTSKEERVVDAMAESDILAFELENPKLSRWLRIVVAWNPPKPEDPKRAPKANY